MSSLVRFFTSVRILWLLIPLLIAALLALDWAADLFWFQALGYAQVFWRLLAIKLGLFGDPYATEEAYLILATQLSNTWLGSDEAHFWSGPEQRLLLPYWGQDNGFDQEFRVSVSRVVPGEIVSEGAVHVPELVQRVRPLDAAQTAFLTFADSSTRSYRPQVRSARAAWSSKLSRYATRPASTSFTNSGSPGGGSEASATTSASPLP